YIYAMPSRRGLRACLTLWTLGTASATISPSFHAHYVNGPAEVLATDSAGNHFVISSGAGSTPLRATKTDAQGGIVASLNFGNQGAVAYGAAFDNEGNLVVAGLQGTLSTQAFVTKLSSGLTAPLGFKIGRAHV